MKWILAAQLLGSGGVLATAAGNGGIDPSLTGYLAILQVPVFGALAWAILTGRIRTRDEMDRVIKERDAEREERINAQSALTNQALPQVVKLQETMKQATDVIVRMEERLADFERRPTTPRRR